MTARGSCGVRRGTSIELLTTYSLICPDIAVGTDLQLKLMVPHGSAKFASGRRASRAEYKQCLCLEAFISLNQIQQRESLRDSPLSKNYA